ncbi:hypothetical protein BFS14_15285 [Serratia fonticola]|uniref:DUF3742 family protein n=1 Tax=Serratia fonticola TaxID=47917 RepID=UPI0008FD36B0|nr:DUF3742 family protein [Serratia fonticola]OIX95219.1 hypothetical protein BFS14_15285 [Serratia fonticola]
MANSASHTTSSAERRGQKLATLFMRAKKSCTRLTAYSTAWAQSRDCPAWVGKVPLIAVGILLFAASLFSILALAAVALLGMAFLLLMGKMHESIRDNPESSIFKKKKRYKNGYRDGKSGYGYYQGGVKIHD